MNSTKGCKKFLKSVRKTLGAAPDEKIDKRSAKTEGGYLAPNDKYYEAHCAYCAEAEYLMDIHGKRVPRENNEADQAYCTEVGDHEIVPARPEPESPNSYGPADDNDGGEEIENSESENDEVPGPYGSKQRNSTEVFKMNLKALIKAQPKMVEDEIAMSLASRILDGNTPYGASVLTSAETGQAIASLYTRARRVYDAIVLEESGGIEDIVAAIEAGDTVNVPELRAAVIRRVLRGKEIEFHTSSMIRFSREI